MIDVETLNAMQAKGGRFMKKLAELYSVADPQDQAILEKSFTARFDFYTTIPIVHTCGHIVRHPKIGRFGVTVSRDREESRECMPCFLAQKARRLQLGELDNA